MKAVSRMIETYAAPQTELTVTDEMPKNPVRRSSMPTLAGLTQPKPSQNMTVSPHRTHMDTSDRLKTNTAALRSARRTSDISCRKLSVIDNRPGALCHDLASTKPGIQCDLRRALSLDYQNRFSKLDISAETAGYTQGAPLARRSPDRIRRDISENLANRMNRERTRHPSFYDIV